MQAQSSPSSHCSVYPPHPPSSALHDGSHTPVCASSHERSGVGSAIGRKAGRRLDGKRVALRFVSTCRPFRITLAAILCHAPPENVEMPTQSAAEWQTLVERTSSSLLRYGCRSPPDLHDEDSFVRVFTAHCRSQKIVNYGRLLATLQFSRACGFTAVIDRQRTQVTGEALTTVVVRTCFATIQV
jgi:hypothetical protein